MKNIKNNTQILLLIVQAFILEHKDYGNEYDLPVINKAIEDGIKQNIF